MARQPRIDYPGALQHVTFHSVGSEAMFVDDQDRQEFLLRLRSAAKEHGLTLHANALMTTHTHSLTETGSEPLWKTMASLGTGYAKAFNRRHRRRGHLFQERYFSALILDDSYWKTVSRYIHLNPLRAGLVRDLDALVADPWTTLAELMGKRPAELIDVDRTLGLFGDDPMRARRAYMRWLAQGLALPWKPDDGGLGWLEEVDSTRTVVRQHGPSQILVGRSERIVELVTGKTSDTEPHHAIDPVLDGLIQEVCRRFGISTEEVRSASRSRGVVQARDVLSYLATSRLGMKKERVAAALGYSRQAVDKAIPRGRALVAGLRYFPDPD